MAGVEPGWINKRPVINSAQAAEFISNHYGIETAEISGLPGERDRNFYIKAGDGREYIFKIANDLETLEKPVIARRQAERPRTRRRSQSREAHLRSYLPIRYSFESVLM